jgi:uncharacterized protein with HEPN domain
MLDAIEQIESFLRGMTYTEFIVDPKTAFAVIKMIEILGEAANHLSDEFKHAHPAIPLAKIIAMRNHLIHQYAEVDLETVWQVYEEHLQSLKESLLRSLE